MLLYHSGKVEATGFRVADAAVSGRTGEALELLRHALGTGLDPVPIVAVLASSLRTLAKVAAAGRTGRSADVAKDARAWRPGRSTRPAASCPAGTRTAWPARSWRSPRPTPRSRAAGATRSTPSSAPSSRWPRRSAAALSGGPARDETDERRRTRIGWAPSIDVRCERLRRAAAFLASADLRLAAWFLWMTPLLTALSSLREAALSGRGRPAASPASMASRAARMAVFSSLLTALLRSCALLVGAVALDLGLDVGHSRLLQAR